MVEWMFSLSSQLSIWLWANCILIYSYTQWFERCTIIVIWLLFYTFLKNKNWFVLLCQNNVCTILRNNLQLSVADSTLHNIMPVHNIKINMIIYNELWFIFSFDWNNNILCIRVMTHAIMVQCHLAEIFFLYITNKICFPLTFQCHARKCFSILYYSGTYVYHTFLILLCRFIIIILHVKIVILIFFHYSHTSNKPGARE